MKRKSKNEYPPDWNQIATATKDAANWECIRCKHAHDLLAGYVLTVHHLDGDKANNVWWNLLALCQRCHLRIQGKVNLIQGWFLEHSDWFKPYVAGYYAHQFKLTEDKEFVMDNIDTLLELGTGTGGLNHFKKAVDIARIAKVNVELRLSDAESILKYISMVEDLAAKFQEENSEMSIEILRLQRLNADLIENMRKINELIVKDIIDNDDEPKRPIL